VLPVFVDDDAFSMCLLDFDEDGTVISTSLPLWLLVFDELLLVSSLRGADFDLWWLLPELSDGTRTISSVPGDKTGGLPFLLLSRVERRFFLLFFSRVESSSSDLPKLSAAVEHSDRKELSKR